MISDKPAVAVFKEGRDREMEHSQQQEQGDCKISIAGNDRETTSETERTPCLSFLGAGLQAVCCGGNKSKTKKMTMEKIKVQAAVEMQMKNVLDFNDFHASLLDGFKELLGRRVSLQLVSAVHADPGQLPLLICPVSVHLASMPPASSTFSILFFLAVCSRLALLSLILLPRLLFETLRSCKGRMEDRFSCMCMRERETI